MCDKYRGKGRELKSERAREREGYAAGDAVASGFLHTASSSDCFMENSFEPDTIIVKLLCGRFISSLRKTTVLKETNKRTFTVKTPAVSPDDHRCPALRPQKPRPLWRLRLVRKNSTGLEDKQLGGNHEKKDFGSRSSD